MPASPRGSREDLDDLQAAVSERVVQGKSLENPGVARVRVNSSFVGRPADAADRLGELELAVASGLAFRHARARAVDRYDRRPVRNDNVNDLLAFWLSTQATTDLSVSPARPRLRGRTQ